MKLLYNLCYSIFFIIKRFNRSEKNRFLKPIFEKINLTYSYYFGVLLNRKYPAYFKKHPVKYGLNTKPRKEKYTVSLTSFPTRIEYAHLAIETVMRQSFKPDNIVLWLAKEQFPDEVIPESLEKLKSKGLTVKFCEDLRSHKKYYYAFKEYPEDNIILVDDDMFYPLDTLKKLVKLHKKHPKDIVCTAVQIIYPSLTSDPFYWISAEKRGNYVNSITSQAFTGNGALFPPYWYPEEVFNKENIKKYAFSADDLWLKAMALLNNVKTTRIKKYRCFNASIWIPNNRTLFSENGKYGGDQNNISWKALTKKYNINDEVL